MEMIIFWIYYHRSPACCLCTGLWNQRRALGEPLVWSLHSKGEDTEPKKMKATLVSTRARAKRCFLMPTGTCHLSALSDSKCKPIGFDLRREGSTLQESHNLHLPQDFQAYLCQYWEPTLRIWVGARKHPMPSQEPLWLLLQKT